MSTSVYFRDPKTRKLGQFEFDSNDHEDAIRAVTRALRGHTPFPRPILAVIDCERRRMPPPPPKVPPGELEWASWGPH